MHYLYTILKKARKVKSCKTILLLLGFVFTISLTTLAPQGDDHEKEKVERVIKAADSDQAVTASLTKVNAVEGGSIELGESETPYAFVKINIVVDSHGIDKALLS